MLAGSLGSTISFQSFLPKHPVRYRARTKAKDNKHLLSPGLETQHTSSNDLSSLVQDGHEFAASEIRWTSATTIRQPSPRGEEVFVVFFFLLILVLIRSPLLGRPETQHHHKLVREHAGLEQSHATPKSTLVQRAFWFLHPDTDTTPSRDPSSSPQKPLQPRKPLNP